MNREQQIPIPKPIAGSHVVDFSRSAFLHYVDNGASVILGVQPLPDCRSSIVDWQPPNVPVYVRLQKGADCHGYQLFRLLIRSEIVDPPSDHDRETPFVSALL